MSSLTKHGVQACCLWTKEDGFHQFSENWSLVTGQLPQDCLGEEWRNCWHPYTCTVFDQAVQDLFSAAPEDWTDSIVIEGDVVHGEGQWCTLQFSLIPTGYGANKKLTILISDVTEHREMRDQVKLAHRQTQVMRHCRASFLSNMSHQLRTPLNAILGFTQMLEKDQIPDLDKAKEYLSHIRTSGFDLLTKISDLLELANIDAGEGHIEDSPVNVSDLLEAVIEMRSHQAFEKDVTLHRDLKRPHLVARIDKPRIMHCLTHVLSEAIEHSQHGDMVTLSCHADPKQGLSIAIHDQNTAISQRRLQNIRNSLHRRESYYQTDIEDLSIGLAITKEIMEMHDGKLLIDSKMGRGTIFTLQFPPSRIVSLSARVKAKNVYG